MRLQQPRLQSPLNGHPSPERPPEEPPPTATVLAADGGPDPATTTRGPSKRAVFLSSCIGTSIEWFDYFIFGTAAALVFDDLFYPSFSPYAATLAAFSSFAVGFLIRPIGAIVFGHIGDRRGRKLAFVLTLVITGTATLLIGFLPTYEAIGVAAPILLVLLRLVQGFAVGGEWGGAVLMSVEHAPAHRRMFYGSFAQLGLPIGVFFANSAFAMVSGLPREAFLSWGWRIPFLLSIVLVVFGFVVRRRLEDAASFRDAVRQPTSPVPLLELVRDNRATLILGALTAIAPTAVANASIVYLLSYGTSVLGISEAVILVAISVSTFAGIPALLVAAALADRYGARRIFLIGVVFTGAWIYTFFLLVQTCDAVAVLVAQMVVQCGLALMSGPQGGLLAQAFAARIRYSGMSIAYQVASVAGGALTPIIAATLYEKYQSVLPLTLYLIALTIVSMFAALHLRNAAPEPLPAEPTVKAKSEDLDVSC
jgi:MFS family permease